MKTASWVLLAIVGTLLLVFSLLSASVAYFGPGNDVIDGKAFAPTTQKGADGQPLPTLDVPDSLKTAIRARRGTAAAYGAAFSTMVLFVVIVPYKRGEKWAWYALATAFLVLLLVTLVRISSLSTQQGVGPAAIPFGLALLGLLLDVGRLRRA
jgi:hypothetical protein